MGVSETASAAEIKSAYRKLALKYHPDKNGEAGKDKFQKIQEAYQILSNEEKRKRYDLIKKLRNIENDDSIDTMTVYKVVLNILSNLISQYKNHKSTEQRPKGHNLIIPIHVELEEIYNNCTKIVKLKVLRNDLMEHISLGVQLANFRDDCVYENMGDNNENDIIVQIHVKDHPHVYIDRILDSYDLSMEVNITLYEYYYGGTKKVEYLNNEVVDILIDSNCDRNMIKIPSKGLPYYTNNEELQRGDLLVFLKPSLPSYDDGRFLSDSNLRTLLKTHFNGE